MRLINEEVHPVANTPLGVAFPWCCCCIKNWPGTAQSESSKGSEGEALLLKKGQSDTVSDPILTYGFGINAYLNIMMQLAMLFGVFTILTIPTFMIYMGESAYSYGAN